MSDPVLRLDEVVVRAGGETILDVDRLEVATGETLAVIGPNGAGKTTLLHVAGLLRRADAGAVTILGQRVTPENTAALRRGLSVVFQDPLLFDIRVLANAAAGLRFQGCARSEADARASTWLERFGVAHLAGRNPRGLSGGESSRVALARAFATEPALLLLDEPFGALDPPTRAALLPTLRARLKQTGAAAILVTHDLDEAFAFGDRLAVMAGGTLLASGAAQDLIAKPPSRDTAALLGVENILPAQVVRVERHQIEVKVLPAGPHVQCCPPPVANVAAGTELTVTLPAAATRVLLPDAAIDAGWNRFPGTVGSVTSLPSGTRLVVETPAPIVGIARWEPGAQRWAVGDRAIVAFSPAAVHLIPGAIGGSSHESVAAGNELPTRKPLAGASSILLALFGR